MQRNSLFKGDVTDIAEFEDGLKRKYNIAEVTKADFFKTMIILHHYC